jgi:tricorn protease-like protein
MAPRNIEIKDLRKFVFISDPQTSPDGKEIAYATNLEADQDTSFVRDIYVMPAKGGDSRKVTSGVHSISGISWGRHGLAYLGDDFHAQGGHHHRHLGQGGSRIRDRERHGGL